MDARAQRSLKNYRQSLDALDTLARVELQDWWEAGNRYSRSRADLIDYLSDPFPKLVQKYGAVAADAAVDHLIYSRSLEDELKWLPTPTPAEVASVEHAMGVVKWAVGSGKSSKAALRKLEKSTTRLVLMPARETVWQATVRDGTLYARIPSPGSCSFCLLLASRGAVYSRENVLSSKKMKVYHDNCRCLAVEAPGSSAEDRFRHLPPINAQLHQLWSANMDRRDPPKVQRDAWKSLIVYKRRVATGGDLSVRWPRIRGLVTPSMSTTVSKAFPGVELPPLGKMPGHVLFGWTDNPLPHVDKPVSKVDARRAHMVSSRDGHRFSSDREGASVFPESWSDQKIVDAVALTLEDPQFRQVRKKSAAPYIVRREVDGVLVEAKWSVVAGRPSFHSGFPVSGPGVKVVRNGKPVVEPTSNSFLSGFEPV